MQSALPSPGLAPGSLSPDGVAEEPDPPSPRPTRRSPFSLPAFCAAPIAVGFSQQDLPVWELAATISLIHAVIALVAVGIAGVGGLACASLIGYSPTRLAQYLDEQRDPDREPRVQELGSRDSGYFVVGCVYSALGWVLGLWALSRAVDGDTLPWALGGWLALMLLVAGSLPAAFAEFRAERTVLAMLPLLRAGYHPLRWPVVVPLAWTTRMLVRLLRLQRPENDDPAELQKQVMAAVADNVDDDSLADAERTWIGNIVALRDLPVSTVMTPRPDIVALPDTLSLREAVDQALEHEFSRYPVYKERIDEVVGVFYVKDALRLMQHDPQKMDQTPLRSLLREPLFVPETTGAAQLLRRVQAGNQHMAIVIDEYGTTVGLATVEDLLEEIVGEIGDEYDTPTANEPSDQQIQIVEQGRIVEIPARTPVHEVNRLLSAQLSEEGDWETVAGLVIASCNRIPAVGETVVVGDIEFHVLDADDRRVQRLRVTALNPVPAEGAK